MKVREYRLSGNICQLASHSRLSKVKDHTNMEKAKRSQNWSESERLAAVELIVDRYDQLFGKFRGATMGAKEKDRKWEEIATALNSSGQTNSLRTVLEIKKMFNNQKTRAKEKQDLCNRTGGGPKPVMTTIEELIIQHMMRTSKPIMEGIEGACESLSSEQETDLADFNLRVLHGLPDGNVVNSGDADSVLVQNLVVQDSAMLQLDCIGKGQNYTKKNKKRHYEDREEDLFDLEKKRLLAEIKKQETETLYYEQKKDEEHQIFLLRHKLLTNQLEQDIFQGVL